MSNSKPLLSFYNMACEVLNPVNKIISFSLPESCKVDPIIISIL